ncbi:MAG TPA: alanine racemase [Solirubrobacteraceae bacterium]
MSALRDTLLDDSYKGIPPAHSLTLSAVGEQGWNVARGDLALPVLTLDSDAVAHNIATMQRYCDRNQVRLAPHGKTTMSPQLFAAQLDGGAWAITAATPTQVAIMRRHGVERVILANQLVDRPALRWVAGELARDPAFEFFCLADDPGTVGRMDAVLAEGAPGAPLKVLVEVGRPGGRAGVRSSDAACEVAEAVHAARHLELAGVEAFEGTYAAQADEQGLARIDELLGSVRESVIAISARGLFERDEVIVTAGGSMYFDRVIALLRDWPEVGVPVSLVLRSGCYVSHDGGAYERSSALAARSEPGESLRLHNALTLWATVLSRPEPDVVIVGAGLRDAPVDRDLPVPRACFRDGVATGGLAGAEAYRVMDQHLFIRVSERSDVRPGDVVALDLSHPCTAFDKFRFIPLVDERFEVRDGVLTFF